MDYFVTVMTSVAQMWLARISESDFVAWKTTGEALLIKNPRALIPVPANQEGAQALMIGPIYHGDTPQEEIYVRTVTSIEILGIIEREKRSNIEICSTNNSLFMQYCSAVEQWKEACSGVHIASAKDLSALKPIPFPKK